MTSKEAYKLLTNRKKCQEIDCKIRECYRCNYRWDIMGEDEAEAIAIEALEKQIPKLKHKYVGYRCVCGEEVAKNQVYCEYCGQRLQDWSEDENAL